MSDIYVLNELNHISYVGVQVMLVDALTWDPTIILGLLQQMNIADPV